MSLSTERFRWLALSGAVLLLLLQFTSARACAEEKLGSASKFDCGCHKASPITMGNTECRWSISSALNANSANHHVVFANGGLVAVDAGSVAVGFACLIDARLSSRLESLLERLSSTFLLHDNHWLGSIVGEKGISAQKKSDIQLPVLFQKK